MAVYIIDMLNSGFDQGSPEERRAYLESSVLHLKDLDQLHLVTETDYLNVLRTHAVSIVDLLAQIQEAGLNRKELLVADYHSPKDTTRDRNLSVYTSSWDYYLACAVADLGHAAGLRIAIVGGPDGKGFQKPELLRQELFRLQLPPTLQHRIDSQGESIVEELADPIFRDIINKLSGRSEIDRKVAKEPKTDDSPPDFRLKISSNPNLEYVLNPPYRPTVIDKGFYHTVSLVPLDTPNPVKK